MGDSSNSNVWKILSQKSRTGITICRLKDIHWSVMVYKLHAYYTDVLKKIIFVPLLALVLFTLNLFKNDKCFLTYRRLRENL